MPTGLTVFVATYLVFIDALLAAGAVAWVLSRQPRTEWVRWAVAIGITVAIGFILAKVCASVYNDPRPFSQDHVRPLIQHAADNGFPSDHGLLAAAIVAAVLLVDLRYVAIFVVLGVLVDWARVGSGIHHVIDVLGSAAFVGIRLLAGYLLAPVITRLLVPRLPTRLVGETATSAEASDRLQ